ncbi:MAG: putative DNA-binding domain-containing protein, partial [Deltaproteobacteria bacterium]
MSEPRHTLDELQRWMQAVITHPGGVAAGIESADARAQIAVVPDQAGRIVNRSRALTAIERLQIYNHAYFARLLECLREEYSVLAAALGSEIFDAFAVAYLQAHPSQSYTLGRLGTKFPDYLEQTRPGEINSTGAAAGWPEFMIDLARLERVVNEVFDGPGAEGEPLLDARRLQAIPRDRWPEARLICVPCLRLVTLSYPVNDYFTAIRRGDRPAIPEPGAAHVAVTRRDYRVVRYPLEPAQFELLQALL